MSNKSTGKAAKAEKAKAALEKEALKKEKRPKKIIIAIVASVLVVAIVILSVKVIIPKIKEYQRKKLIVESNEVSYELLKYKDGAISSELYDILLQAEKDSKAACKKYGMAISFDEYTISVPEMEMAYYDAFSIEQSNAQYFVENYGSNLSNFPYDSLPEDAPYNDKIKWSDYLLEKAGTNLRNEYYLFDKAINSGFIPTDAQLISIKESYKIIDEYAENGKTDEYIEKSYCEGVTYSLYARSCIYKYYANYYEEYIKGKLEESYTDSEINSYVKKNNLDYRTFYGRICALDKKISGYESLETEEEYIEFCENNSKGNSELSAEKRTDFYYRSYEDIEVYFGSDLADYLFSDDRAKGEISLFKGSDSYYLIYVDCMPEIEVSANVVMLYAETNGQTDYSNYDAVYEGWKADGGSREKLLELCNENENPGYELPYGEGVLRAGDIDSQIDNWLRDPSRKAGDSEKFVSDSFYVIIYFDGINKDDTDLRYYGGKALAFEDFKNSYLPTEKEYVIAENINNVNLVPYLADEAIKNRLGLS